MDRLLPFLRMRSARQVLIGTLVITAIAVAAPVATLMVVMSFSPFVPWSTYLVVLAVCAAIPLLIAPPISLFALSILRMMTITIERVDDYVRHDALTGVLTRAYLLGQVRERISRERSGSFLMVDADHFKTINDRYGHDVGDEALRRLGEVMRNAFSAETLIGRLGGEEFGVFLPGASDAAAARAANQLCAAMRADGRTIAGHEIHLTVSIGGAVHKPEHTLEKTMKLADAALYHAKRSGRDGYFIAEATDTMSALILRSNMGTLSAN